MSAPDFQAFQQAFGRHLRDPHHTPRPAGVPARRMAVYNELLFNNITGFLDACFPVCRKLLGETNWRRLNRAFFRDWKSHTPWFREIPREFVRYLNEFAIRQPLPAWFAELAHYEWTELALDVMDCPIPEHDPAGDLMQRVVILNPVLLNLTYAWPVHRIGPDYRPRKQQTTQLVVYRNAADAVKFVEINPVTARLLVLLALAPTSGEAACQQIADELHHPEPAQLQAFGKALLEDFRTEGIILGAQA
ncbi:MAG: putative DNA-binding domain-containing protein [Azonexus sp.]|nr:putative DNA-binding domain-containing protein [Azonexus sp.]